jgi:uncharacterized protein
MTYLVDGHNLIPHIPGLSLRDPDDESALVSYLHDFCRLRQKNIMVFFDQAPVGHTGISKKGRLKIYNVPAISTADAAIMRELQKLGKRAKNVIVVSSDRQVQQAARAAHARVLSASAFAGQLQPLESGEPSLDPRSRLLSQEEVEEWEAIFRHANRKKGDS